MPHSEQDVKEKKVPNEGPNQSHGDFYVRRVVVHQALQWLIVTHNVYCHANHVHIDQNPLAYTLIKISLHNYCTMEISPVFH